MKRTTCPHCNAKFKVLSAGNTDGAKYVVTKARRKGGGEQLKKVTGGSKYQLTMVCGCKAETTRTRFTIIGRSKAHAMHMLRRWRAREKKIISVAKELVL